MSYCCVCCRSADVPTRKRYVRLVEGVRDNGGTIKIFSCLHISGERESIKTFMILHEICASCYIHMDCMVCKLKINFKKTQVNKQYIP